MSIWRIHFSSSVSFASSPFLIVAKSKRTNEGNKRNYFQFILRIIVYVSPFSFRILFFQFHDSRSLFGNHEYLRMQHTFTLTHMYRFHMDLHLFLVATSSFSHGSFIGVAFCARFRHWLFDSHSQFYLRLTTTHRQPILRFSIVTVDRHDPLLMGKQGQDIHTHTLALTHKLIIWSNAPFVLCMSMPRRGTCFLLCQPMLGCSQHGERCTLNIHLSSSYSDGTQNVVRWKCKWKIIEKKWCEKVNTRIWPEFTLNDGSDEWRAGEPKQNYELDCYDCWWVFFVCDNKPYRGPLFC